VPRQNRMLNGGMAFDETMLAPVSLVPALEGWDQSERRLSKQCGCGELDNFKAEGATTRMAPG